MSRAKIIKLVTTLGYSVYFEGRETPLRKVPSVLPPRLSYARNKSVEAYIYPRLW